MHNARLAQSPERVRSQDGTRRPRGRGCICQSEFLQRVLRARSMYAGLNAKPHTGLTRGPAHQTGKVPALSCRTPQRLPATSFARYLPVLNTVFHRYRAIFMRRIWGSRFSIRVDVHDRILTIADNLGVELAGEVLNRCRGPVQWQAPWFVSEPVSQSFA